jgi:hypothetical protein
MEPDQIQSAVSDISSDLGFGKGESTETVETETSADTAVASDTIDTTSGVTTDALDTETRPSAATETVSAPTVRAAPKSWAKETHDLWSKLSPEAQTQIELREKQAIEGIAQYSEKAKRADQWETAVKDYMPIIQAQGVQPQEAVRYLFEAHKNLSAGTPEQKAAYLAKVAKSYGIDMVKAGSTTQTDETPAQRETRERIERLENERAQEKRAAADETSRKIASEVSAFADAKDEKGNAKHPYFDECHEDIVAYINAGHPLEKAYEKAVYANPVTRAKELARLQTENEAALRAKAKKEAETARNASRTNVNTKDTRRAPTASKTGNWEDTLTETLQDIKSRTPH